jgi:hypothetical protein
MSLLTASSARLRRGERVEALVRHLLARDGWR